MTGQEYLTLKNTVRVLRLSGVPLSEQQQIDVQKYEKAIKDFEQTKIAQYEAVVARGRKV